MTVWVLSLSFFSRLRCALELLEMIRVSNLVVCPIVSFFFVIEVGIEECSKLWKICGPFPQVSWEVQSWIVLYLIKLVGACVIVAFPIVFIFLWDQSRQEGVLKLKKNGQFWVFLAVRVLFPNFLGRFRSGLY